MNLRLVAEPGDKRSLIFFLLALLLFAAVSFRLGNRQRERAWPLFCAGAAWMMALYVLGNRYFGWQVAGNTVRLAPEFDLALWLAIATALAALRIQQRWRLGAAALALLALLPAARYLRHLWSPFPEVKALQQEYPREITHWVETNLPGARVLPSGEVRFWSWGNTAQPDGGSLQGMLNQMLPMAIWQILKEKRQDLAVLWLQALGTDAVIVPDETSRDVYRGDFVYPAKFRGLRVLHNDGQGTVTYQIPRTYPGIGRVVDARVLESAAPVRGGDDRERLAVYASEIEKPGRPPVVVNWSGFDNLTVRATTAAGESVLLQETWDPFWRAEENGKLIEIRRDPALSFMLMPVEPGPHQIHLRFETPLENRIGQIVTVFSILAAIFLPLSAKRNLATHITVIE